MNGDHDAMFSAEWLARLILLLAILVALVSGMSRPARARWRRGVGFAAGVVLGGTALLGLAGLALRLLVGPEGFAGVVALLPGMAGPPATLPNVIRPTPRAAPPPPRAVPRAEARWRIDGVVTRVRDGDTIEVAGVPVRFERVDCAERGTRAGDAATQAMRTLAHGRQVTCALIGRRSYDREIGTCRLGDGRELGEAMVARGLCAWR